MIGRLHGILIEKSAPDLLIDVGGVGYEVQVPMTTLYQLPEIGSTVLLHTHMVVREDAQLLFGFVALDDRRMFRELIRISGVGPKLALAILSGMDSAGFARLVANKDSAGLTSLPGVGKKTAERLVVEMYDRLQQWQPDAMLDSVSALSSSKGSPHQAEKEAISALIALGYSTQQASRALSAVVASASEPGDSEELIRRALRSMAG